MSRSPLVVSFLLLFWSSSVLTSIAQESSIGEGEFRNTVVVLTLRDERESVEKVPSMGDLREAVTATLARNGIRVVDRMPSGDPSAASLVKADVRVGFLGFFENDSGNWFGKVLLTTELTNPETGKKSKGYHSSMSVRVLGGARDLRRNGPKWTESLVVEAASSFADDTLRELPSIVSYAERAPPQESPPVRENRSVRTVPTANGPRRQLALAIGIDDYVHLPKLKNAVSDAEGVARIVRDNYGFADVALLTNEVASRQGILDALKRLINETRQGDDVLIYYAGHGVYDETLDRGYWIPQDAKQESQYLANSEVVDCVKAMDKKGVGHVLIVSDSCFSGTLLEKRDALERGIRPRKTSEQGSWIARVGIRPSRRALTSGASDEPVPDGKPKSKHSIFAESLMTVLKSPDYPTFTGTELSVQVRRIVGRNSDQSPQLGVIQNAGDKDGEFVFSFNEKK